MVSGLCLNSRVLIHFFLFIFCTIPNWDGGKNAGRTDDLFYSMKVTHGFLVKKSMEFPTTIQQPCSFSQVEPSLARAMSFAPEVGI